MIQGMKAILNRYQGLRGAAGTSHKWLIYSSQQHGPLLVPASCALPGTQQTFHDCVQNCSVSPIPISCPLAMAALRLEGGLKLQGWILFSQSSSGFPVSIAPVTESGLGSEPSTKVKPVSTWHPVSHGFDSGIITRPNLGQ